MLLLLALSVLSIATVGSVVVYQRQATARLSGKEQVPQLAAPPPPTERTFETLQVGDVVAWGDEDWVVRQRATYDEEGDHWWLYALDDGSGKANFLEVRRKDGTEVAFMAIADDAPLFGQLGNGLTFRGEPYILDSRGDARMGLDHRVDAAGLVAGRLQYSRYKGPGGLWLVIEESAGNRRAYAGEVVAKKTLSLMPGSTAGAINQAGLQSELDRLVADVEKRRS